MIDIQNDENMAALANRLKDPNNKYAASLLKQASIDVDFSDLVDSSFADQENRVFPIFSPEFATISALHMQTQEVSPLIKEACKQALSDWDIEGVSPDMVISSEEVGISPDRFLIPSRMKLPIVDSESLEKSASALTGAMNDLNIAERMKASEKLYKIATTEYGVDPSALSNDVIRYSQNAPCDLNKLASSISERYAETHNPSYQGFIEKLGELKDTIGGSVSFDRMTNGGIAVELWGLDKEAGVTDTFDAVYDTFNSPEIEIGEGEIEKVASSKTIDIGGHTVCEDNLMKLSAYDIDAVFSGLSQSIFEGNNISIDKLLSVSEDMTTAGASTLGRFLSE